MPKTLKGRLTTPSPRDPRISAHMPLQLISRCMQQATLVHSNSSATSAVSVPLTSHIPRTVLDIDPPAVRCRSTTAKKATSGQTEMIASCWRWRCTNRKPRLCFGVMKGGREFSVSNARRTLDKGKASCKLRRRLRDCSTEDLFIGPQNSDRNFIIPMSVSCPGSYPCMLKRACFGSIGFRLKSVTTSDTGPLGADKCKDSRH